MLNKPNTIVYLRRNNLIVGGKHITSVKLTFTPDIVNNLELIDTDKFISACQDFFSGRNVKGKRVLVVLDQSMVFTKTINLDESGNNDEESIVDNFVAQIPFEQGKRACVKLRLGNKLNLYATNADIHLAVQDALHASGMRKLIAVTPAVAYKIDYSVKPAEVIEQFIEDKVVRRSVDFSTVNPL